MSLPHKLKQLFKLILLCLLLITLSIQVKATTKEETALKNTIAWNALNNNADLSALKAMYSDDIFGYAHYRGKNRMLEAKKNFFQKNPDFKQSIVSDVTIKTFADFNVLCEFTKNATIKGKTKSYPSYLLFREINGKYLIIEESDSVTNANRKYVRDYPLVLSKVILPIDSKFGKTSYTWFIIGFILLIAIAIYVKFVFTGLNSKSRLTKKSDGNKRNYSSSRTAANLPTENKDRNYQSGLEFEKHVVSMFNDTYFKVIRWQGDKGHNGRWAQENSDPDLVMELETYSKGCHQFAVECKYRTKLSAGIISICRQDQFDNYQTFGKNNDMPVFLILGVGGSPNNPRSVYCINLKRLSSQRVSYNQLNQFQHYRSSFFYDPDTETLS